MLKQISDAELVNSNTSSSTGSSTEHLKAPTRPEYKVWKHFGFVTNEAGVIVRRKYSLYIYDISFCGNTINLSYYLEQKHPTTCLIDFHGANKEFH